MKRKHITILILFIIAVSIIYINSIVVCYINPHNAMYMYELLERQYDTDKVDICILNYDYVTGASWRVEKSTNREIENTYVCIDVVCNPRDLKINKKYDLDYLVKYVVVVDKNIEQSKLDNENINVLKIKDVIITGFYYCNDGTEEIRFGELTFGGKIKSALSFFVPILRVQM